MSDEKNVNPWADEPDEAEAVSSESGGNVDIIHFKPLVGRNTIRIVGHYKWFKEYWLNKVQRSVIAGPLKDCPIHNHPEREKNLQKAKALRESGKEKEAKELFKKTFQTFDPKVKYAVNIIDRADGVVKIWKFSRAMKDKIAVIAADYGDPTGYDLILTRRGKGLNTEYTILPAKEQTPLSEEEKKLATYDLEKLFKPTPLERIKAYLRGETSVRPEGETSDSTPNVEDVDDDKSELSESEIEELGNVGDDI